MNKKSVVMDFTVLLWVLMFTIVLFSLMFIVYSINKTNAEDGFYGEYHRKDLIKYLRTPANILSEDYDSLTISDFIIQNFDSLDEAFSTNNEESARTIENEVYRKFYSHTEEFVNSLCAYWKESNNVFGDTYSGCTLEIKKNTDLFFIPAKRSLASNSRIYVEFYDLDGNKFSIRVIMSGNNAYSSDISNTGL